VAVGEFSTGSYYIQWGGNLPGKETWSCGMRVANVGETPLVFADTAAELGFLTTSIVPLFTAFHSASTTKICPVATLTYVKFNRLGVDGKYVNPSTNEYIYPTPIAGGGGSIVANQLALVVTLRTAVSRGPANKGRFYLPMPTAAPGALDGLIPAGEAKGVADNAWTLISGLNAALTASPASNQRVSVMSRTTVTGKPATNHQVTDAWVGRVLDTQRRRRRSLVEDYQT